MIPPADAVKESGVWRIHGLGCRAGPVYGRGFQGGTLKRNLAKHSTCFELYDGPIPYFQNVIGVMI